MANEITRYYPHPEVVQLIFGQLLSQQITLRFFCHCWQLVGFTLFHLSNNMNVLGSICFPMDALFL